MPSRVEATGSPAESVSAKPAISPMKVLSAISVTIMLAGQLAVALAALVWSVTGLLHLPLLATETLAALTAVPALWVCYWIARMAWQAEIDPDNN